MNRFDDDDARGEPETEAAEGMILDLARLRPAAPSLALRERIAADLAAPLGAETTSSARLPTPAPRSFTWLAERMLWAAGGAIVAAVPFLLQPRPLPAEPLPADTNRPAVAVDQGQVAPRGPEAPDASSAAPTAVAAAEPPAIAAASQDVAAQGPIAEESLAWSDDGVQFIDGQIPARVIRHWVLERFPGADGEGLVRPREDVFVVPVALR